MTTGAGRPGDREGLRRRLARDAVLQGALALIAVQLVFRGWAIYGGWFAIDDFNFISRMGYGGLGLRNASESYFGHVMPAAMYLSWLNHLVAPWSWYLPATELLVLQAAADLSMLAMLLCLFGSRPGIVPPLAIFLFSAISIEGAIWYAAAINLLPFQAALFTAVAAHVTYLRTGRLRFAVAADIAIVAGLLFNEKTALAYLVIAVLTLGWFAEGTGWGRVRSALRGRWPAFVVYGATGVVHLVAYLVVGREFNPGVILGYPTYRVAANVVLHGYVPGIVGGPFRWFPAFNDPGSLVAPGDGMILAALVVVGLVLNEVLRHRRFAARALLLPAIFLLIDTVLVLVTRAAAAGPLISLDYRYQGELAGITAMSLALATLPLAGATQSATRRSPSELLDHPSRVAALTVIVSVLGLYSSTLYVRHWHDYDGGRRWVETATTTLDRATDHVPLIDGPVPPTVTNGFRFPENLQSRVLARQRHASWVTVATDDVNMIDAEGRVLPAAVPPVRRALPGPVPSCGYEVQQEPVVVPLDGPVGFGGWWVRIGYLSSADSPVRVTAGGRSVATTVRSGVHALYLLGGTEFDSVTISPLAAGVRLCSDDITVGHPEPVEVGE